MSVKNILKNITLIEFLSKENGKYDKGMYNNWVEVFGENKILWFWPMKSKLTIKNKSNKNIDID